MEVESLRKLLDNDEVVVQAVPDVKNREAAFANALVEYGMVKKVEPDISFAVIFRMVCRNIEAHSRKIAPELTDYIKEKDEADKTWLAKINQHRDLWDTIVALSMIEFKVLKPKCFELLLLRLSYVEQGKTWEDLSFLLAEREGLGFFGRIIFRSYNSPALRNQYHRCVENLVATAREKFKKST